MRVRIAVTDHDWFSFLKSLPEANEVSFWKPGGERIFRGLKPGELFLFKLHRANYIVGGGIFVRSAVLPYTFLWDALGVKNGVPTLEEMRRRIERYRRAPVDIDSPIGCILLQDPFFFDEPEWITAPVDFPSNIVQGKTYESDSLTARDIWEKVQVRLLSRAAQTVERTAEDSPLVGDSISLARSPHLLAQALHLVRNDGLSAAEIIRQLCAFRFPGLIGTDGQPLRAADPARKRIVQEVQSVNARLLEMSRKDPEIMRTISPREFEQLVAELLAKQGYEVELTPPSRDGGFDIYAAQRDGLGSFLFLVECKRYRAERAVGVEVVRSLHGVVQQRQATAGVVATTSFFTRDAKAFQQSVEYKMSLRDFADLRLWLEKLR